MKKILVIGLLVLAGCGGEWFIFVKKTFGCTLCDMNLGTFDVSFRRFRHNWFWIDIDYDLNREVFLRQDVIHVCHRQYSTDVIFYSESESTESDVVRLKDKGKLHVSFYTYKRGVFNGDTIMLYMRDAIYTAEGTVPIDSVMLIAGDIFQFKDWFTKKKGKAKYGRYRIKL
jgi:hypothetical protein